MLGDVLIPAPPVHVLADPVLDRALQLGPQPED